MKAIQRIYCGETLLVQGRIEACITTLTGKPRRIPAKRSRILDAFPYRRRDLNLFAKFGQDSMRICAHSARWRATRFFQ